MAALNCRPGRATISAGKVDLDHVGPAANHDNDISDLFMPVDQDRFRISKQA